jgi:predicted NBD/HSP70 family sugar kinase
LRSLNEQVVLETVLREGPVSRADIARLTNLSKPTVSAVMGDLEACGLVCRQGRVSGGIGRPPTLYEVNPRAGYVVGIDVGGTEIYAGIADLFGEVVWEASESTRHGSGEVVVDQIGRMCDRLLSEAGIDPAMLRAAGVGVPGVYDPTTDSVSAAYNLPGLEALRVSDALQREVGVPTTIDNDVNLAAIGERWRGRAVGMQDFVAISVGTGIGMGILIDGEVYRGRRGAAGEIGFLPLAVSDPFDPTYQHHGPFEWAGASQGIGERMDRAIASGVSTSLTAASSVAEIFDAAAHGDEFAGTVVNEEARVLALGIASVVAVLDPELVVLGGGVGANPLLLEPVRGYIEKLLPDPPDIHASGLGGRAAFHGAIAAGLRTARQELLREVSREAR